MNEFTITVNLPANEEEQIEYNSYSIQEAFEFMNKNFPDWTSYVIVASRRVGEVTPFKVIRS